MNAYLIIIIVNVFYLELSVWGLHYFIELWRKTKGLLSFFCLCTFLYLTLMVYTHVIPVISPLRPRQNENISEISPKLYFYFQLSATWCLFQLGIGHTITYWLSIRGSETKYDKAQSATVINKKKEPSSPPKNKILPMSFHPGIIQCKTNEV